MALRTMDQQEWDQRVDKFWLLYQLKCKNREFVEKEVQFFEAIPVHVLAKKPLEDQSKMVDFVTRNAVDNCSTEAIRAGYVKTRQKFKNIEKSNVNQAGLGNIAYILLRLNDSRLSEEWRNMLQQMFP